MDLIKEYSDEIAKAICEELTIGKSLVSACRKLNVCYQSVFKWIHENEQFLYNYTRAREAQADYLADAVLDVADDLAIPPDSRRIMVDSRKWYAGKLKPKKYGDSTQLKHADADGNKLDVTVNVISKPTNT